ncbi:hypothetical protein EV714DRAFT_280052 [Schizophyllum commune]
MPTFATLWRTWISTSPPFHLSIIVSPAASRPPPWNRPAAPRRPAGARPQRGPRVNLLNWRANWRLSLRGRFWLRSWGNQIESPPGYSVPPSIEMDAASRCILAPRQVATELAVEGACGPHVVVEGAASTDIGLGCTTCKTSGRPAMLKSICKSSRQPSPTYLKTARGWWWGTSECTMTISALMVRFGVGMGRANSLFRNVKISTAQPPSTARPINASTSTSDIRLRPCASRPPWNRCTVSGRCAGARPHRGPRVNLLEFGEGQLACFLSRCRR